MLTIVAKIKAVYLSRPKYPLFHRFEHYRASILFNKLPVFNTVEQFDPPLPAPYIKKLI